MLASDVRHDYSTPAGKPFPALAAGEVKAMFDVLERQARAQLESEGFTGTRVRIARILDCRYHRQVFSVEVPVEASDLAAHDYAWLTDKFTRSYRALYQHSHDKVPGFIDTCRVAAFGLQSPPELKQLAAGGSDPARALRGARRVYLGSWIEAPIYWFDDLAPGMTFSGPALVDSASTSVLVARGSRATIDPQASIVISTEAR